MEEAKEKLRRKIRAPDAAIEMFVELLLSGGLPSPVPDRLPAVTIRDPDDVWVLASAIHMAADVLVTGDRDLLDIADSVDELSIVTPRALRDVLQAE